MVRGCEERDREEGERLNLYRHLLVWPVPYIYGITVYICVSIWGGVIVRPMRRPRRSPIKQLCPGRRLPPHQAVVSSESSRPEKLDAARIVTTGVSWRRRSSSACGGHARQCDQRSICRLKPVRTGPRARLLARSGAWMLRGVEHGAGCM